MDRAAVERLRAFNRNVLGRSGTIGDRFLGRKRPYGASRILWHIGHDGADVRELRARLDLDSGYMSRVLRLLQRQRLITIDSHARDARVRRVKLTIAGRSECAEIDRRSNDAAWAVLEPLNEKQRRRLIAAMHEVERLLLPSAVRFDVENPKSADARWCLEHYFAELKVRFSGGFDHAKSLYSDAGTFAPPSGAFIIARLGGKPVGCGAIIFLKKKTAYFKRMWLAPDVRGNGLGRRLLAELERVARKSGATNTCLETHRSLREAIALYRSSGYREVAPFNDEPYADYWFQKSLRDG